MKKLKKCHENFIRSNFSKGLNYLLNRGVKKFCKMKKNSKVDFRITNGVGRRLRKQKIPRPRIIKKIKIN
jgi:hypothetical protein